MIVHGQRSWPLPGLDHREPSGVFVLCLGRPLAVRRLDQRRRSSARWHSFLVKDQRRLDDARRAIGENVKCQRREGATYSLQRRLPRGDSPRSPLAGGTAGGPGISGLQAGDGGSAALPWSDPKGRSFQQARATIMAYHATAIAAVTTPTTVTAMSSGCCHSLCCS